MDLYFEMYSGIAGDMTIGALLDLGASKEKLTAALKSIDFGEYDLVFDRVKKNGLDAYNFDVKLHHHDHDHEHEHEHHKDHDEEHHHHHHEHRNLKAVEKIIDSGDFSEKVKKDAKGIFEIIAKAESKAHGVSVDEVFFHEVGAVDSIIDVIGTCVLLEDLNPDHIYFSEIYEARGYQECAHGFMPLPVPAVANIIADSNLTLNIIDDYGERTTPTGAAIVAYFTDGEINSPFKIKKIGVGAGNSDFEKSTNILRVMEIESKKKQ